MTGNHDNWSTYMPPLAPIQVANAADRNPGAQFTVVVVRLEDGESENAEGGGGGD